METIKSLWKSYWWVVVLAAIVIIAIIGLSCGGEIDVFVEPLETKA